MTTSVERLTSLLFLKQLFLRFKLLGLHWHYIGEAKTLEHLKTSWSKNLCSMEWRMKASLVTVHIAQCWRYWCRRKVMFVYGERVCWTFIIHVRARFGSWKLAHWVILSRVLNNFRNLRGTSYLLQFPYIYQVEIYVNGQTVSAWYQS